MTYFAGFRFAMVDTGQLYLRHLTCGEIDFREVTNLENANQTASSHVCPVKPEKES